MAFLISAKLESARSFEQLARMISNLLRMSGHRLGAALGGLLLARKSSHHPVCNTLRKNIRPLTHGLVRDAYCIGGGGDSSSEQFNGFCFVHFHIEP